MPRSRARRLPMTPRARAMVRAVLADSIPVEQLAEHLFVAAALQVHFARLAARLERQAPRAGRRRCLSRPAAAPPVASMVVGWPGAHGTRFCACSLCGTLWNYVRIKCTLCGSTKGIAYQEVEDGGGHGAGRNLRELPRLREDPSAASRSRARAGRRRRRKPRPRSAGARTRLPARRRQSVSARLLSAWRKAAALALRKLPSVDEVMRHAALVAARNASAGPPSSPPFADAAG